MLGGKDSRNRRMRKETERFLVYALTGNLPFTYNGRPAQALGKDSEVSLPARRSERVPAATFFVCGAEHEMCSIIESETLSLMSSDID